MEVLDIDVLVRCSFALAPKEQTFLGGHFLHGDVLNGEPEDDGPDHTKSHLDVAIDDFCKKVKKYVKLIETRNWFGWRLLISNSSTTFSVKKQ